MIRTPSIVSLAALSLAACGTTDVDPAETTTATSALQFETVAMGGASSNDELWSASNATDQRPDTAYSSRWFPGTDNSRGSLLVAWVSGNGPQTVDRVVLTARMTAGRSLGFPASYELRLTKPDNSDWESVGVFTAQPDISGVVVIKLPRVYTTYSVYIRPTQLGADDYGNHYFQLAEISLGRPGSPAVRGYVDRVTPSDREVVVAGWACDAYQQRSIDVHLYAGGPAGTGRFVKAITANLPNEAAVSSACGTSGINHRFEFHLTTAEWRQIQHQRLYVHGLSTQIGGAHLLLGGSGELGLPAAPSAPDLIVDCEVAGNCAGGAGYAYAPSIVQMNGEYHVFYCSQGADGVMDFIRYTRSQDGVHWSAPVIKLAAKAADDHHHDLAACDPSVVHFGDYFYLYYGSAFRIPGSSPTSEAYTNIQVARAKTIDGVYETYTERGTWESGTPADAKRIISPLLVEGYGAGQPSVVVYGGKLRMFYNDFTADKVLGLTTETYRNGRLMMVDMVDATKPELWTYSVASRVNSVVMDGNTDIVYDPTSGQFLMYMTTPAVFDQSMSFMVARSLNGKDWDAPTPVAVRTPIVRYWANNPGVSHDDQGHVIAGKSVLLAFGAPRSLTTLLPDYSKLAMSLYGFFLGDANPAP